MDFKDAKRIGDLLARYGERHKGEFVVKRLAQDEPLESFHNWANDRPLVSADLVQRDNGALLHILLIDWQGDGDWYCVLYPENRSRSMAEIWYTERSAAGAQLIWHYSPTKQDGLNPQRKSYFQRYVGDTTLFISIPSGIQQVPRFLRDLFDLADLRQRADRLDQEEPERREEFPEGALVERLHRDRERNSELIQQVKRDALRRNGKLVCQVCSFDFEQRYGTLGHGFIEAHHTKPLHELTAETVTRPEDIALVCANCHRMLHRRRPWLSIGELREVLPSDTQLS